MMFPHTITIYHHTVAGGEDIYSKTVLNNVYYHAKKSTDQSEKGVVSAKETEITASPEVSRQMGKDWNVFTEDRIVLGEGVDIQSWKELKGAITVTGIDVNVIGCAVDNVVITGR